MTDTRQAEYLWTNVAGEFNSAQSPPTHQVSGTINTKNYPETIASLKIHLSLPDFNSRVNRDIKKQGYGDNFAWTLARVTAPATISDYQDHNGGGLYVSASSWQDCPTGPPAL